MMKYLRLAFGLLTVVPMRRADELSSSSEDLRPGDLGRAAAWFPLVGLVIGGLTGGASLLLARFFPPLLSAALTLGVWVALSGGLHLDGLADCCDAMLGSASREKRLEILRDPRLGTFGGVGLGMILILKFAALASLPQGSGILPFVLAAALGRWLALLAARQPMARPGGMGADMALGMTRQTLLLGAVLPLLLILLGGWRGLAAALLAHLLGWGIFRLARARLGGVTGDVMGLAVETVELMTLLVFVV